MEERLPKGALGGQAVIEGVMMKGPDKYSVAVRKPDQKIEVKLENYQSFGDRHKICKLPFLRGVVNFIESMVIGMKTLTYSSSFYDDEEEESKADKLFDSIFKDKAESVLIGFTVMLSIVIAVALFMMLPAFIAQLLGKFIENFFLLAVVEGIIRLTIFLIYVVLISQMQDIKRVFMYHGAEHKTINCYESGEALTPENVAKHTRYHKRCGTSFMFIVLIVSIFVFMFINTEQMWLRFVLRLVLVPVVASISYEFIRLAGRHDNVILNILSAPGMWVQKLTTKEPTEEMIQVAIISVEAVIYGNEYVKAINVAQGIRETKNIKEAEAEFTEEAVKNAQANTAYDVMDENRSIFEALDEEDEVSYIIREEGEMITEPAVEIAQTEAPSEEMVEEYVSETVTEDDTMEDVEYEYVEEYVEEYVDETDGSEEYEIVEEIVEEVEVPMENATTEETTTEEVQEALEENAVEKTVETEEASEENATEEQVVDEEVATEEKAETAEESK